MPMTVTFEDLELPELRAVLDRAMNTWEPADQPGWLAELSARVDKKLGIHVEPQCPREATRS